MTEMESTFRKIPPHDNDAERAVIASMLMDQDAISVVDGILVKKDFYNGQYALLFEAITAIYEEGKPVDEVILAEKLRSMGAPEELYQRTYLGAILADQGPSVYAAEYAEIVRDKSMLRQMIRTSDIIARNCYAGQSKARDIIDDAEEAVLKISKNGSSEFVTMRTRVGRVIDKIEEASKRGGGVSGLSTGFIDLDNKLTGLHPGELILVAARPAMGKTAFVLNIANHVLLNEKVPVAIFSLEMDGESLVSRMVAMNARVDAQKLRTGQLTDDDWDRVIETTATLSDMPLFIEDSSAVNIADMRSKCRQLQKKEHIGLVILDYLQLMTPKNKIESRQNFVADVSRGLKSLARELGLPVIALSQVNREAEKRGDHKPSLADLRESGSIEQDADVVIFISREDYYDPGTERQGIATINVAKQRNGATGPIELLWDDKHTRFANYERKGKY